MRYPIFIMKNEKLKLIEMAEAFITSRAIHVVAYLNIADLLVDGPVSINTLALKLKVNADALYRLLRLLASHDIFKETAENYFSLTPLAEPLLSNHPDSLRTWLAYHDADEKRWRAYGSLLYSVETGRPAFDHLFGTDYFSFISKDPVAAQQFDEGMKNISADEEAIVAASYDFSPYNKIVDIGGGMGGFLAEVLQLNRKAQGIVYDLEHTISAAKAYLATQKLQDRTACIAGSFFESVPEHADLYILKRILHDWDDASCIKILKACRKSMGPHTKLLIMDTIIPAGNTRHISKDIDVAMLVLFGGRERTEKEWHDLLAAAQLQLVRIYPTPSMLSIIEVKS
jgi:hypothetical protein